MIKTNSAGELFKGHIKVWYNSRKCELKSWSDIVIQLKENFLVSDYGNELFE